MNDQHAWPAIGSHVTLHTPNGPQKYVVRSVTVDRQGIPYATVSTPADTHWAIRRIDVLTKGWPA